MYHWAFLLLALAIIILVVSIVLGNKTGFEGLTCGECVKKGGKCNHDKSGEFASCTHYPHGNPHHGSSTYVAQPKPDAYYTFYGVPNFSL